MSSNPADAAAIPKVSVIIAAFASERWNDLRAAVRSAQAQTLPGVETIVVIDHNPDLLDRAKHEFEDVTVVANSGNQGASGARNSGVAVARGEMVAFLDDDAVASGSWLEDLMPHFADPNVVGVGGKLIPLWATSRPRWFPDEFNWAVGASFRGMPEQATYVRNVWSSNMVLTLGLFNAIGGFRADFGKVGNRSRPEDTDLCLRAAAARPGGTWMYEPAGVVGHRVPPSRTTIAYFMRRCLHEGSGKAALAALNGAGQSTSAERQYTRRVLPQGIARGLRETARGDAAGGLRSIAIAAGLSLAVVGFATGRAAGMVQRDGGRQARPAAGRGPVPGREEDARGANSR